jgi:hypothetical protein
MEPQFPLQMVKGVVWPVVLFPALAPSQQIDQ